MANPLRGCYLNGLWYRYVPDSFKGSISIKNVVNDVQGASPARTYSLMGTKPIDFSITLAIENEYSGPSGMGTTNWIGISRMAVLSDTLSGTGSSMPILFVTPYGTTYSVVPIGEIDLQPFNSENPSSSGMEFRASLTLASV